MTPFDKNASATATIAAAGAVTAVNMVTPGTGYLTPGLKKFVDTLAGLGPTSHEQPRPEYIPVAVPDTTTYSRHGLLRDRSRPVPPEVRHGPAGTTLLRGYVQLSTAVVPGAHLQLTNAN